jgi:hypothetical protein
MLTITTPKEVTSDVSAFSAELATGQTPLTVQVQADDDAVVGECFQNVRRRQHSHGGSMQLGWIIWECPKLFLEAEFHAVWADTNGALTDVTPKGDGESEILFLPDPTATYSFEDDVVPRNRRFPIVEHPDLTEFFRLVDQRNSIIEKYDRKPPADEIAEIEIAKMQVEHRLAQQFDLPGGESGADPFTSFLNQIRPAPVQTFHRESPKVGRNDPCPCGSGKKFKKCCGLA